MLSGNFQSLEIRHGIIGGLIFGPGTFLGLSEVLGIFLGFDFCPHSDHPRHLKSGVPPLLRGITKIYCGLSQWRVR